MADDTLVLTGPVLLQVSADKLLVTPTGGTQTALADALNTATGGAVAATTLTASGAVMLNPANANVSIAPTGSGTHAINNVTVGVTTQAAGSFTTLAASGASTLAAVTATGVVSLTNASVSMTAIPTADPHVVGRLWANSGVLTISAG
jgi:hypothetical protein